MKILEFDEWLEISAQFISEHAAESGADRELDYNPEQYAEDLYDHYLWDSLLNEDM
jgi:hypothetical protein